MIASNPPMIPAIKGEKEESSLSSVFVEIVVNEGVCVDNVIAVGVWDWEDKEESIWVGFVPSVSLSEFVLAVREGEDTSTFVGKGVGFGIGEGIDTLGNGVEGVEERVEEVVERVVDEVVYFILFYQNKLWIIIIIIDVLYIYCIIFILSIISFFFQEQTNKQKKNSPCPQQHNRVRFRWHKSTLDTRWKRRREYKMSSRPAFRCYIERPRRRPLLSGLSTDHTHRSCACTPSFPPNCFEFI